MTLPVILGSLQVANFLLECKQFWVDTCESFDHPASDGDYNRVGEIVCDGGSQGNALIFQSPTLIPVLTKTICAFFKASYTSPIVELCGELIFRAFPLIYSGGELLLSGRVGRDRTQVGRLLGLHTFVRRSVHSLVIGDIISSSFGYLSVLLNLNELRLRCGGTQRIRSVFQNTYDSIYNYFFPVPQVNRYKLAERIEKERNNKIFEALAIDPKFASRRCPITHDLILVGTRDDTTGGTYYDPDALLRWVSGSREHTMPLNRASVVDSRIHHSMIDSNGHFGTDYTDCLDRLEYWSHILYTLRIELPDEDYSREAQRAFCRRIKTFLETEDKETFKAKLYTLGQDYVCYLCPDRRFSYFCKISHKLIRDCVALRGQRGCFERAVIIKDLQDHPEKYPNLSEADLISPFPPTYYERFRDIELDFVDKFDAFRREILDVFEADHTLWQEPSSIVTALTRD